MKRKMNILITGRPGVGKTTLILRVLEGFGMDSGGFYTRELREKGKRVGFELCTLEGKRGVLAHTDIKGHFRVGKYGVDLSGLEELGVKAVNRAIRNQSLIIIDEIGKMELYSTKFRQKVTEALNSSTPVLATIGPQAIPFLQKIKSRPDVEYIEVTPNNRDDLVTHIQLMLSSSWKNS